jgi:hypothetical protein
MRKNNVILLASEIMGARHANYLQVIKTYKIKGIEVGLNYATEI